MFIAYHVEPDHTRGTPIAVNETYDGALEVGIRRILSAGILHGALQVQDRADIEPAVLTELKTFLDGFFSDRGIT